MTGFLPEVTGSMSLGADGNPTVVMMEAAFAHHGLNWRYLNLEISSLNLEASVAGALAMGWRGFNVSMPHKLAVASLVNRLGRSASIIGSVNCVVRDGNAWVGENTDGRGFLESLRPVVPVKDARVVLLGAGGAARAIAVELALAGASDIVIVNRNATRAFELAALLAASCGVAASGTGYGEEGYRVNSRPDILVNATSVGLYEPEQMPPVIVESIPATTVVADVVFNPVDTALLNAAKAAGCVTVDGLGMLVNQGALAFQYWTGIVPDREIMRTALENALRSA